MSSERLQKILANSGITSRRKAEGLILEGKVSVNGSTVSELGQKADLDTDRIVVDGVVLKHQSTVVYLLNKPRGVVSTAVPQGGQKIVLELVPPKPSVHPIGRLDKESEGLLLLTNNGTLTNTLTHPSFKHSKVYRVYVKPQKSTQPRTGEWIHDKLLKGVKLGDGLAKADSVVVRTLPGDVFEITISVHEGRHHLIRRMCATIGFDVTILKRTKIGNLTLGNLKSGQFRPLTASEIKSLT